MSWLRASFPSVFIPPDRVKRFEPKPTELFDIVRPGLGLLEAQDVRLFIVEIAEKILSQHRAQTVDVPGNNLYERQRAETSRGATENGCPNGFNTTDG
jgi:CO dehydrogenase/acetyl-CoA synthase alpha subunit